MTARKPRVPDAWLCQKTDSALDSVVWLIEWLREKQLTASKLEAESVMHEFSNTIYKLLLILVMEEGKEELLGQGWVSRIIEDGGWRLKEFRSLLYNDTSSTAKLAEFRPEYHNLLVKVDALEEVLKTYTDVTMIRSSILEFARHVKASQLAGLNKISQDLFRWVDEEAVEHDISSVTLVERVIDTIVEIRAIVRKAVDAEKERPLFIISEDKTMKQ